MIAVKLNGILWELSKLCQTAHAWEIVHIPVQDSVAVFAVLI